ncbi:unnamed protein product [Durusdinium trenchii]|uniref:Uncharacterized protein n=1 Tax=Durusdinium trenchii TaxID=1381693 RepID=A0ABP0H6A3_9DINO
MAPRVAQWLAPWLFLLPGLAEVERPEGCSESTWTSECLLPSVTCESLATAGLTCGGQGVGAIPGCGTICAEPCCITTTTTTVSQTTITQTSTETATTTHTSTSHTVTVTSATGTRTGTTATVTATSTATVTQTATLTKTGTGTGTSTHTSTLTATATSTLFVNTTEATTAAPTTSPRASTTSYEGPTQRLVVRVKVTKVQNNVDYITDSRVSTAYREVMQELTQLPTQMIDLQMVPQAPGNLTVSFILTVPEKDVTAVQETLKAETPAHFGAQVTRYVNTYVGEGLYTQEVVSIEEETSDYVGLNAAASLTALRSLLILGALQIARATEH